MNWLIKATLQKCLGSIPGYLSDPLYYAFQRSLGSLRNFNPLSRIAAVDNICRIGEIMDFSLKDKRVLEIGTGWCPVVPLFLWIHGSKNVVSCDLNRYFNEELLMDALLYIRSNAETIVDTYNFIDPKRLEYVLSNDKYFCKDSVLSGLRDIGIHYLAPANAAMLPFEDNYFDLHTSFTVLEHVHPQVIPHIFSEGKRLVRNEGAFIHCIDYSDHFSNNDAKLSQINFLRFNEFAYSFLISKYSYMNRLRHDDFLDIFSQIGLSLYVEEPFFCQKVYSQLSSASYSFKVAKPFSLKSIDLLSTTACWFGLKL